MGRQTGKKQALFDRGLAAARAVTNEEGLYICPLCQLGFDQSALHDGALTMEHVPPRSLGGKAILLTCARCNSTAGHTVDAAAASRAKQREFVDVVVHGKEGSAGLAEIELGGVRMRASVSRKDDKTRIKILDGNNSPSTIAASHEHVREQIAREGGRSLKFKLSAQATYSRRLADVSDLRAAFLVCSAAFGYTYACHPRLEAVRQQLRTPEADVLLRWSTDPVGSDNQVLVAVEEGLVLVTFGGRTVVLPYPSTDDDTYAERTTEIMSSVDTKLNVVEVDWPTTFHAVLDLRNATA